MINPIEEIKFYSGIMRDHGDFILNSLSYNEDEEIKLAKLYKDSFSRLHDRTIIFLDDYIDNIDSILTDAKKLLMSFINFKKKLLSKLLECNLNTSLPPTFYNHMINEATEFSKVLTKFINKENYTFLEILNLHEIWLPDASGHAVTIANNLDPVEKPYIKEAKEFEEKFNSLTLKNIELSKMLTRTNQCDGTLRFLNEEVKELMDKFVYFMNKIKELRSECKLLGVISPHVLDHMIREEKYYISKISLYN